MFGVVNKLYICNQQRSRELNDRISVRNIPSAPLQPQYSMRPVLTKYSIMPIWTNAQLRLSRWNSSPHSTPNKHSIRATRKHRGLSFRPM